MHYVPLLDCLDIAIRLLEQFTELAVVVINPIERDILKSSIEVDLAYLRKVRKMIADGSK